MGQSRYSNIVSNVMQDASDKFVVNAEKEEVLFVQEKIMTPTRNKFVLRKLESGSLDTGVKPVLFVKNFCSCCL